MIRKALALGLAFAAGAALGVAYMELAEMFNLLDRSEDDL